MVKLKAGGAYSAFELDSRHEKLHDMTMANVWANLFGPFWPNVWLWFGHTLLRTLKGPSRGT